ncbi:MAG TPA: pyridoxamine 5'-phosphate oxidase [Candidatus Nitrosotenuis sp.]|jgi:pyridoxamine 5'-phosphate oxidase|nr:pyridoxamine 5'-phosphate oxidase [Candidatus Nitrosotenuis sp.]
MTYLEISALAGDPLMQLERWYTEARQTEREPEAMVLATAGPDGRPSARFVLLRGLDSRGIVFFTNYTSRKAAEMAANPFAAAVLYWPEVGRQVRLEGPVEKVSAEESRAYFRTRPRENQLAALVSPQSQVIPDRAFLEERFARAQSAWEGQEIPCPSFWGGYRLRPDCVEFWQRAPHRLHDRFRYRREGSVWVLERLAP